MCWPFKYCPRHINTAAAPRPNKDAPNTSHGKTITEDVVEIKWEANNKDFYLPNEQFDEFSFLTRLPTKSGPYWINVRQECTKGVNDWAEVPSSGTSTKGLKSPAALLELLPSQVNHQH